MHIHTPEILGRRQEDEARTGTPEAHPDDRKRGDGHAEEETDGAQEEGQTIETPTPSHERPEKEPEWSRPRMPQKPERKGEGR